MNAADLKKAENSAPDSSKVTATVDMWYGSEKKEQARIIPQSNIVSVAISESMFSSLPTARIVLNDTGDYLHNVGFRHGAILCITITPNLGDPDEIPTPYVSTKFVIQSIEYLWNPQGKVYDYTLRCIYAAEKYLTATFQWPPATSIAGPDIAFVKNLGTDLAYCKTGGFTSDEVLMRTVGSAGLTYVCDITGVMPTDDRMYWLNKNLTYQEFVKMVVDHAWIAEDDCPIFYVNINGVGVYSSLKTLQKSSSVMTYKDRDKAQLSGDMDTGARFRVFTNPSIKNAGYLQNEGGYKVEANVWNPYHVLCINPVPRIEIPTGVYGSKLPPRIRKIPLPMPEYGHERTGVNENQPAYIAKMTNKSDGAAANVRFVTNDIYFMETHQYYDYAPLHNKALRKAFFNVFVSITVDCTNQLDFDAKRKRRDGIGDKITIDFADTNSRNSIQNGNFIIGSILHFWSRKGVYQQVLGCVTDGINGLNTKNNDTVEKGS